MMKHHHPRNNEQGLQVELTAPSQPTALSSWDDPSQIATAIPDGTAPATLNGITFAAWTDAPTEPEKWQEHVAVDAQAFDEPPMLNVSGKSAASGAVILEEDGRVWVVSPSNAFGGYVNTFPKGTLDHGLSMRANALKEVFEESGLRIVLTGFLCDSARSTSVTRYYTGRRVSGNPTCMGWETQAVHLVPKSHLAKFVSHHNDRIILQALQLLG